MRRICEVLPLLLPAVLLATTSATADGLPAAETPATERTADAPPASPPEGVADPKTAVCRITDERVARLQGLVVTPAGMGPFVLWAEDVAVTAGLDGDATPGVHVKGRLEFVASAPDLPLRAAGGLVTGANVTVSPDSSILRATADADGLLADVSIGRQVTVRNVRLPCSGLGIDFPGRVSWASPATPHDSAVLFPKRLPLRLADGPTAEPTVVVEVSDEVQRGHRRDYLPLVERDSQGDRVLVSLEWHGGASISGWARRSAFVAGTVHMGFGGPSGGGEGRCLGHGSCSGPTVYCGPADVAAGAVVYAEQGAGPWATVLDGEQLEVRAVGGEEWVRLSEVPGLTENDRCGALDHAWVARDKVRLPDDEPRPRPGACEDGATGLFAVPVTADAQCGDYVSHNCTATVPFVVRNCSGETVELLRLELGGEDRTMVEITPAPDRATLAPGGRFEHSLGWITAGTYELRARARTPDGFPIAATPAAVVVRNPALEAAQAACRACDGTWSGWGIAGVEGCDCTTRDAGRACTSDAECEGRCMFDGWAPLDEDDPLAAAAPTCADGEQRLVAHGRCSERTKIFGCVSVVGSEPRFDCRRPGLSGRAPTICID
ncbi:MAG: hypothetical protein JXB32_15285 [Deltaproteobacteria bacterium]|nr:hypothetical protein [Deltaproteobacteria bacterium]